MANRSVTPALVDEHQQDIAWLAAERERTTVELGRRLVRRLQSADRARLRAVLADQGRQALPVEILGYYVAAARAGGATWQEIGDALGMSRQGAHKRFAPYEGRYRRACDTPTQRAAGPYPPLTEGLTSRRGHDSHVVSDREMSTAPDR